MAKPKVTPDMFKFFVKMLKVDCSLCGVCAFVSGKLGKTEAAEHLMKTRQWRFKNKRWVCGSCAKVLRMKFHVDMDPHAKKMLASMEAKEERAGLEHDEKGPEAKGDNEHWLDGGE